MFKFTADQLKKLEKAEMLMGEAASLIEDVETSVQEVDVTDIHDIYEDAYGGMVKLANLRMDMKG